MSMWVVHANGQSEIKLLYLKMKSSKRKKERNFFNQIMKAGYWKLRIEIPFSCETWKVSLFFCWGMDSMMWRNKIGLSWFSSFSTFFSFLFIFHSKKIFSSFSSFFLFLLLSYIYKLYQKKMLLEIKSYRLLAIFILGRLYLLLKFLHFFFIFT